MFREIAVGAVLTNDEGKELDNDRPPYRHGNDLAVGPAVRLEAVPAYHLAEGDEVENVDDEVGKLEDAPEPGGPAHPVALEGAFGPAAEAVLADAPVARAVVRPERPGELVNTQGNNGNGVEDEEHELVHERVREKGEGEAVDAGLGGAVGARAGVAAAGRHIVLPAKQVEAGIEADSLRGGDNGEQVLHAEAEKRVPVADALVVQAYLHEKHGQHAVLRDVERDGTVDDDFAPKSALLGVDNDGEDGGDLHGKDKPALGFLELDERGGNGDAGAG